ncbi:MAG: hypothetical protein LN573_04725 [Rickettsia endosymbiont of Oxypoda opaca]|nr:hypothetical protein [Rickettsia endosymbiont of Oxypoda opaca]
MRNIENDNNLYKVCGIKENYDDSDKTLIELKCIGAKRSFYCLSEDIKYFKKKLSKEDIKCLREFGLIK